MLRVCRTDLLARGEVDDGRRGSGFQPSNPPGLHPVPLAGDGDGQAGVVDELERRVPALSEGHRTFLSSVLEGAGRSRGERRSGPLTGANGAPVQRPF